MRLKIEEFLEQLYPDAYCELNYNNDYELLINIILSAQTTDKAVNKISKDLFINYPNIISLSNAEISKVEEILKPLGLAKVKSRNIVSCCKKIISDFNGLIPSNHNDLLKLDGVGNKTANVFLAVYYNIPTFAVDTHVKRVANRLNISKESDVNKIESDLKRFFEKNSWIKLHHQLIFFGRYFCTSKNPKCNECALKCFFSKKTN